MLVTAGAWAKESEREAVLRNAQWGDFPGILGMQKAQEIRDAAERPEDLREELQEAILSADLEGLEAAVRRGASLQRHYSSDKACPHSGYDGSTLVNPVDWAVLESCPNAARRLLELEMEKVVSLADGDSLGVTSYRALHIAARRASVRRWIELVKKLLECGADISRVDPWGRSPLHIAVMNGNAEAAQIMLNHGAWAHEEKREEVLKLAANQRVKCVLEAAAQVFGTWVHEEKPEEVLKLAASQRIKFVLEAAAQVPASTEVPDKAKATSPHLQDPENEIGEVYKRDLVKAIKFGDMIKIKMLLDRGADLLTIADLGYGIRGNLIDVAVFHHREQIALELLKLGSDRGLARELAARACHAVFWAVQQDYLQLLEELLKHGADPGQIDDICGSALRFAAEQSRSDAIVLLLEAGAWKAEPEKDLVRGLLQDRRLLQAVDFASGRGLGTSDQAARARLEKVTQEIFASS
jgi:ankyrin repeat protein